MNPTKTQYNCFSADKGSSCHQYYGAMGNDCDEKIQTLEGFTSDEASTPKAKKKQAVLFSPPV